MIAFYGWDELYFVRLEKRQARSYFDPGESLFTERVFQVSFGVAEASLVAGETSLRRDGVAGSCQRSQHTHSTLQEKITLFFDSFLKT